MLMQAFLHCNVGVDYIGKFLRGEDDPELTEFLLSFYLAQNEYKTHVNDIYEIEKNRRIEEAKVKGKR